MGVGGAMTHEQTWWSDELMLALTWSIYFENFEERDKRTPR